RHRLAGRGRANLETELGDAGPAARDGEGCNRRWRTVGGHHDGLDELGRADAELTTGAGARLRDLECDTVVARLGELMGDAGALAVRRAVSPGPEGRGGCAGRRRGGGHVLARLRRAGAVVVRSHQPPTTAATTTPATTS